MTPPAGIAVGQTASLPAPANAATASQVTDAMPTEVIVTANRRAESAQHVPIAVTEIGGDQAAKAGISTANR